jgi:hypothetical protein
MPVKIDPEIVEELAAVDLVIWEAKHPKMPFFNEKTGKWSQRENKGRVIVTVAGPGVPEALGGGTTLREAVDSAIKTSFPDKLKGVRGALLRLDEALLRCYIAMMELNYKIDPESLDDDVPF